MTFELTEAEVEVLSRALGRQPYDEVAAVVAKMQAQIILQNTARMQNLFRAEIETGKPNGASASVGDS